MDDQSINKSAAEQALDDIARLCGVADWEYPGQVVRDVCMKIESLGGPSMTLQLESLRTCTDASIASPPPKAAIPIPMVLDCPRCHGPHVDADEWARKSHRTHLCEYCGAKWRPALVPTVGVHHLDDAVDTRDSPETNRRAMTDPPKGNAAERGEDPVVSTLDALERCEAWFADALGEAERPPEYDDYRRARSWCIEGIRIARATVDEVAVRAALLRQLAAELRGHWPDADLDETIHEIADTYDARAKSYEAEISAHGDEKEKACPTQPR